MFNPISIINLRNNEIVRKLSNRSKYFIKTKYVKKDVQTGGYHKFIGQLLF